MTHEAGGLNQENDPRTMMPAKKIKVSDMELGFIIARKSVQRIGS